jgi:hypothetical protein
MLLLHSSLVLAYWTIHDKSKPIQTIQWSAKWAQWLLQCSDQYKALRGLQRWQDIQAWNYDRKHYSSIEYYYWIGNWKTVKKLISNLFTLTSTLNSTEATKQLAKFIRWGKVIFWFKIRAILNTKINFNNKINYLIWAKVTNLGHFWTLHCFNTLRVIFI